MPLSASPHSPSACPCCRTWAAMFEASRGLTAATIRDGTGHWRPGTSRAFLTAFEAAKAAWEAAKRRQAELGTMLG